jgi:hypothetical protein
MCRDAGVIPQEYLLDNGSNFTSKAFAENLLKLNQKALFAGIGAHHHNGIAERHIQTIMAIARSMLIHSAVHWPAVAFDICNSCMQPCDHEEYSVITSIPSPYPLQFQLTMVKRLNAAITPVKVSNC